MKGIRMILKVGSCEPKKYFYKKAVYVQDEYFRGSLHMEYTDVRHE